MSTLDDLLHQGIAAARAGRRDEARELLMQVVEADERSEQAWLWLAGVVTDPQDMRTCLENVLDLNPANAQAQQGLAWVNARYGPPPATQDDGPATAAEQAPVSSASNVAPAEQPAATAVSYTGPTTRLAPQPEPAVVTASFAPPPQPALPSQPTPAPAPPLPSQAPADGASEQPCPYCGAPTPLSVDRCRQCRNGLTLRTAPPDRRSISLTILGWLWVISGLPELLLGLAIIPFALLLPSTTRGANAAGLAVAVVLVVIGLIYVGMGRALLRRQRWAYYIVCFFTLIGLLTIPYGIIQSAVMLRELPGAFAQAGLPPRAINIGMTVIWVVMFVSFAFQLLYIVLVGLSYRDFFGPKVRLLSTVEPTGHMEHYNSGVAYKDRGMWYMAAKEWEAAVAKAPRDLGYLHALGLAYAQLKQFDRARTTLDNALQIAPEHPQLKESRALVDRMAGASR